MLHLGPRLSRILDEVKPPVLWDLGADHGHLGLAALERGLVERVVLVDKSAAAMKALGAQVAALANPEQQSRITLIRADAARLPPRSLNGTVVVAGLGARSIQRIVEGFVVPNVSGPLRLVLQPEVEAELLETRGLALTRHEVEERDRTHVILVGDLSPGAHD